MGGVDFIPYNQKCIATFNKRLAEEEKKAKKKGGKKEDNKAQPNEGKKEKPAKE